MQRRITQVFGSLAYSGQKSARPRPWALWLLLGLFIAPFILALYLFSSDHANRLPLQVYGELQIPPLAMQELPLTAEQQALLQQDLKEAAWLLVHIKAANCDAPCLKQTQVLPNIHKSLGKSQRHLKLDSITASSDHPYLEAGDLWVLDSSGHLVLRYQADWLGNQVLKDLKRLLRASNDR